MHRTRRAATGGLVLALALGLPATNAAAAPGTPSTPRPATPAVGSTTVTLITGDQVTVTRAGGAAVRPGAGREHQQFLVRREHGHLSVVPRDAVPLLRSGQVDRRLFDVTGLIAARYDDAHRDNLPLLVSYREGQARRATTALPGTRVTRDLPAIGGAALTAGKSSTGTVWSTLTGGAGGARLDAAGGVERIWLDGRRAVSLDHSVPQIGAPTAWAAGWTGKGVTVAVLDTGVDATHPDLAGKVTEARNFSETPDQKDTVGHGTHVASTIAGSGAASGGKYRGVAPDAKLLDGKVCEEFGCAESAILAGMQWATVDKRATVVNMSLGGGDTPEVDPLEEAVQTLTAQTGSLFVIAAGNDGRDGSVGSPGSADAALTVGAVDRDDELADFSSRGPRVGDDALKPDITAPGVDIVAARSADGQIGDPVGTAYVALSGTSMATPHVAGSVALLAQQHPGWKAGQLKATLMAAARPHPTQTAYEQGAGRVDLTRAVTQQVTTDPVSLSFGRALWPHGDDAPITRTVAWHNGGTTPLTLDLTVEVKGPGGKAAPAGMFTLGVDRITVPAGGRAETTVTANTRLGVDGYWTGRVVARSGGTVAVTPLAVHREVESYTVTLTHLDRSGRPGSDYGTTLVDLADGDIRDVFEADGVAELRLPKGRYGLSSVFFEPGPDEETSGLGMLAQPELVVDGDTAVTIDLRKAKPVRMTVPQADARVALVDISANYLLPDDGVYGFGIVSFDTFDGLSTGQLGPAVSTDEFVAVFNSQWIDRQVQPSPYLYALSETVTGRLPSGLVRDYRPRDLATVVHKFRDPYPKLDAERLVFPDNGYNLGGWAVVLPTDLPGQRTEHYSTRGVRWESELDFGVRDPEAGWLDVQAILLGAPTKYQAGRRVTETWGAAPLGPSLPAPRWPEDGVTRIGDTIMVNVALHSDAAGHPGGSLTDSARTALWRNGKLVAELDNPGYGEFTVPQGAADYQLTVGAGRSLTDLGTEVEASWTFRSGHVAGDTPKRLPLSEIRFTPRLTAGNTAPAGRIFAVPVQVRRQPDAGTAKLAKLGVDVSYDGGKTWRRATVVKVPGQGTVALVDHPAGAGYVSLRATARDTDGNTASTRIIQAYRLA
ncbi:S8 family serine peptidase [Micromonospora sp. WMMD987]|uniref:S8 family serine peptidase n=1 Tax=Micromonospora TaxID=1873 RepID=UPI00249BC2F2|nr:S8 family serine peptidase [Micromonospora sp. WMMD987]WFE94655.1 S8 family serine peptidase [Micromonospora sp. WMMD987]